MTFNDNSSARRRYYQVLNAILDIHLSEEELQIEDYIPNMTKMFGAELLNNAIGTVSGEIRFLGLTKTNMKLVGLDKHLKLIESYQKLKLKRQAFKN
jgi:ribosomal protein S12 methylthiotransferase accessory factor